MSCQIKRGDSMNGNERRENIIQRLKTSKNPIPAKKFANEFNVSRQVIVQDIALLRANKNDIISTNRGYILNESKRVFRVFKVNHTDSQTQEELNIIVDYGGIVEDVFIYHRNYGMVKADMNISNRSEIKEFMDKISSGKSTYLKNVTSGYHYHTVSAPTLLILDLIQQQLEKKGFLAKLQDYEPIDFWDKKESA